MRTICPGRDATRMTPSPITPEIDFMAVRVVCSSKATWRAPRWRETLTEFSTAFAGRFVSSLLYGVGPTDPIILATAATVLISVATLAGYVPARRASRLDPMTALREE